MTPTNLEELKRAAEAALDGDWLADAKKRAEGRIAFKKLANPVTVLSLISELEAERERRESAEEVLKATDEAVTHAIMVLPFPSSGEGKRAWSSLIDAQSVARAHFQSQDEGASK